MKALTDIWSSITGNVNTRAKDPVIGSFVIAWTLCNWDKLAILFFGENKIEERIASMANQMAIIETPKLVYQDLDLIVLPIILTLTYLFILPSISLWVNKKQKNAIIAQHSHAVELDIEQAQKQRELNKEKLRSNPNKGFLEKDVELDIQRERERAERRNKIQEYIDHKVSAANALAIKQKAEAEIAEQEARKAQLEADEKDRKSKTEKLRFEKQSQILKATVASNRFPAAYMFLQKLSTSLRDDDIHMSLEGLSECVAAIFGYSDFQQLLDDKNFTNENLEKTKYILADDNLVKRLTEVCEAEVNTDDKLDPDVVFDHIQSLFEDLHCDFLSMDGLVEAISMYVDEDTYNILYSDELSGPMAETDTIFERLELVVTDYEFKEDFSVHFHGYASGHHRKEEDMSGRDLEVNLTAIAKPILGSFGFGELEYEIGGMPREYE